MKYLSYIALVITMIVSLTSNAAERIYFVQNDHLGTPEVLTDATQSVVWQKGDRAFGDAAPKIELAEFNIRFPGQYFDSESGLHYNWNRYYDPITGRYITSDPIGLDGGLNTFGYVFQNPLKDVDPTGLEVYRCWALAHPSIKIESKEDSCSAEGDGSIDGEWGFGPAAGLPTRLFKLGWWQNGAVSGQALPVCTLVFAGNSMDQFIYDRISRDIANPPAYHGYWFNSVHWSNNILFGGNAFQRGIADGQANN